MYVYTYVYVYACNYPHLYTYVYIRITKLQRAHWSNWARGPFGPSPVEPPFGAPIGPAPSSANCPIGPGSHLGPLAHLGTLAQLGPGPTYIFLDRG